MLKTEDELMAELVESIFSGNVDGDDSKDDDKSEDADTEEKDTDSDDNEKDTDGDDNEDESKDDDSDDESKDDDSDEKDSDDDDDDDDSDSDDSNPFGGDDSDENLSPKAGGAFKSQVKSLKKQYNDLLVDSFEKYSTECIEDALDEVDSAFGENIEDILNLAMDKLKEKIMGDLGVEGSTDGEDLGGMMPPAAMGSFDPTAGADNPMEISIERA